jgi:membrane-associated HD superfamily phosphohydrolase
LPNHLKKLKKSNNKFPAYVKYIGLGFQILLTVLIGVLVGQWLDQKLQTDNGLYTIICSVSMIIVSLIQIIRTFLK